MATCKQSRKTREEEENSRGRVASSSPFQKVLPAQPEGQRNERKIWAAAGEHLVITRFGKGFKTIWAKPKLQSTTGVESTFVCAERGNYLVHGYNGRKTNPKKGSQKIVLTVAGRERSQFHNDLASSR